jgi:hypothetical protein
VERGQGHGGLFAHPSPVSATADKLLHIASIQFHTKSRTAIAGSPKITIEEVSCKGAGDEASHLHLDEASWGYQDPPVC